MRQLFFLVLCALLPFISAAQDKIIIPIDIEVNYNIGCPQVVEFRGKKCLSAINYQDNSFRIYDLKSGERLLKIQFPAEGPEGIGEIMGSALVEDKIMVMGRGKDILYFFNLDGTLSSKLTFESHAGSRIFPHAGLPAVHNSPYLFITNLGYPVYIGSSPGFFKREQHLEYRFNLADSSLKKLAVDHPAVIKEAKGYILQLDFSRVWNGKELIYSWYKDDQLYTYDAEGKKLRSIPAKSRFLSNDFNAPYYGSLEDLEAATQHVLSQGRYLNLIYNKFENCYYRMVLHAYTENEIATLGKTSRYETSNISIIKLDSNFNIIEEKLLKRMTYLPDVFFVTEEGLYLSTNNSHNEATGEDELVFEKISFSK